MMQFKSTMKNFILKSAKTCYDSPANFWQTAAIATISVYHLCQIFIIAINNETPKREKAFLIPQEAMDGVINLATFLVFAEGFKRMGRSLVKKGIVKPFAKNKKAFSEEFATTTNLVGSLFAVNIASPVIRNKFGAEIQKKFIKREQKPNPQNPYRNSTSFNGRLKI